MKAERSFWAWQVMLVAGLIAGSAEPAARGDEPAPPVPASVDAIPLALVTATGDNKEWILEGLPAPRVMMWDERVLYNLRLRLAGKEDEEQRKQQRLKPGPNRWRAGYGDVAPLALVPQPTQGRHEGGLAAFHAETERLEARMRQGQASAADFFLHGLIHYECGYLPIALWDFDQAIRLPGEPSDQYYSLRGLAHYGLGEYREAWKDLDEAVRRVRDVRNLNNRGVVACIFGQTARGLQDFEDAINLPQGATEVNSVYTNRALAMSDQGRHEQAAADLRGVIASGDPYAVIAGNYAAGFVYRRMGQLALSGYSYNVVIEYKRADNVAAHGQPSMSAINQMHDKHSFLDEFAGEETAVEALIGRGIAHHQLGQVVPAIIDYGKAIAICPKRADAYVNRAVAYLNHREENQAVRDLDAALQINPNDPFALANRGLLRMRQGQSALGQADLDRCGELRKDLQPIVQRISAHDQQPQPANDSPKPSPWHALVTPPVQPSPSNTPVTPPVQPFPWYVPATPPVQPSPSNTPVTPPVQPFPWSVPATPPGQPSPSNTPVTPPVQPFPWYVPAEPSAQPSPSNTPAKPAVQPLPWEVPAAPPGQPSPSNTPAKPPVQPSPSNAPATAAVQPPPWEVPAAPSVYHTPFSTPATPAAPPSPSATAAPRAHRPYTAANPAEAVAWLAEACKNGDFEAKSDALAFPLGRGFHALWDAAGKMNVAWSKYKAARNEQSGDFLNAAGPGPMEELMEREKKNFAADHEFVVQTMDILESKPVGDKGDTFRLVVQTIKMNARGERETPKEIYYAVREGNVWKLLPEQSWLAASDEQERKGMMAYFDKQYNRLQAMREIIEKATQALIDGKPISEPEIYAAWTRASAGVPVPGMIGNEPPTVNEILFSKVWEKWGGTSPPQADDLPPPVPGAKPKPKPANGGAAGQGGPSAGPAKPGKGDDK